MAAPGRRPRDPLTRRMEEEAWNFEFHQAVRLIEALVPGTPVGRGSDPREDAIRFRSQVSLAFPASELAEIHLPPHPTPEGEGTRPARLTVSFFGLASALGPLPRPFTELVLERIAKRDYGLRDFLDIFNHRLVSYHFRTREKHRPGLRMVPPEESVLATPLFSLAGLGEPSLRNRTRLVDRGVLAYAASLGRPRKVAGGIAGTLEHYFGVPVRTHPFQGRWHELAADQWSRLGGPATGARNALGVDTVLGTRAWDQSSAFELAVGPLTVAEFSDFLPGDRDGRVASGKRLAPFTDMARLQVGVFTQTRLRLLLRAEEVPSTTLTAEANAPRLGYTSWLGSRGTPTPADEVLIGMG